MKPSSGCDLFEPAIDAEFEPEMHDDVRACVRGWLASMDPYMRERALDRCRGDEIERTLAIHDALSLAGWNLCSDGWRP